MLTALCFRANLAMSVFFQHAVEDCSGTPIAVLDGMLKKHRHGQICGNNQAISIFRFLPRRERNSNFVNLSDFSKPARHARFCPRFPGPPDFSKPARHARFCPRFPGRQMLANRRLSGDELQAPNPSIPSRTAWSGGCPETSFKHQIPACHRGLLGPEVVRRRVSSTKSQHTIEDCFVRSTEKRPAPSIPSRTAWTDRLALPFRSTENEESRTACCDSRAKNEKRTSSGEDSNPNRRVSESENSRTACCDSGAENEESRTACCDSGAKNEHPVTFESKSGGVGNPAFFGCQLFVTNYINMF